MYKLTREPALLGSAEGIMAVMGLLAVAMPGEPTAGDSVGALPKACTVPLASSIQ